MNGKERRAAIQARAEEGFLQDPSLRNGKKWTELLVLFWVMSRLFFFVMDLICVHIGFIDFNPVNIWAFLLSLFLALLLYKGAGMLAVFPLLGGILMASTVFRERMLSLLSLDLDGVLRLHILSYIIAAAVQILTMSLLLFLPACKSYSELLKRVVQEVNGSQEHRL